MVNAHDPRSLSSAICVDLIQERETLLVGGLTGIMEASCGGDNRQDYNLNTPLAPHGP